MVFVAIRTIAFFLSAGHAGMAGSKFAVPHYTLKMLKDDLKTVHVVTLILLYVT